MTFTSRVSFSLCIYMSLVLSLLHSVSVSASLPMFFTLCLSRSVSFSVLLSGSVSLTLFLSASLTLCLSQCVLQWDCLGCSPSWASCSSNPRYVRVSRKLWSCPAQSHLTKASGSLCLADSGGFRRTVGLHPAPGRSSAAEAQW